MGYLIDTCIWVDVERGALSPADVESITGKEQVYLSPVTIAELECSVVAARRDDVKSRRRAAMESLLRKPVLIIDAGTGRVFGHLAAHLAARGRGKDFRVQDVWMASQAIQHGLRLLTSSGKGFEDIPGLDLVIFPGAAGRRSPEGTRASPRTRRSRKNAARGGPGRRVSPGRTPPRRE